MKRALVTGITGQDGRYLAQFLTGKGYQVFGLIRGQNNPKAQLVLDETPSLELVDGDLRDLSSLIAAVEQVQPDEVYNLGAMSFVKLSWSQPELFAEITGLGVLRMLEAVRIVGGTQRNPDPLLPSVVLGDVRQGSGDPADRAHAVPSSLALRRREGVRSPHDGQLPRVVRHARVRPASSSTTAPNDAASSSSSARSRPPSRIKLGLQDSISLGNLDSARDWGYAGDYVEAMWLMLQQDEPDDYVVASGKTHTIRECLDVAFRAAGYEDWTPYVQKDPRFERPAEVDLLIGDATKAREKLGWIPRISFEELVTMMYESDLASERAQADLS